MIRFTSDLERRRWLLAGAVVLAVLSTLGPARGVAGLLREQNLLRATLAAGLVAVLAPVAWRWVRSRPGPAEFASALAVAGLYLWVWARVETPEERTHLFEYGVLAVLTVRALEARWGPGRRALFVGGAATLALGWLDEAAQFFLPGRVFDWRDLGFNTFAVSVALGGRWLIGAVRRARKRR